ncbi:MAG TPA: hypothetical protein VLR50_09035 [Desulfobacterales bacterium]|nr:hypothetical protein [Desulfobacterales bacterium]
MITYSVNEASRILGIEKSRVRDWIVKGFIIPSWHKAMARGDKNLLTYDDLCYVYLFQQLLSMRLHSTSISFVIREIGKAGFSENLESNSRYVVWDTKNPKEGGNIAISTQLPTSMIDTLIVGDRRVVPRSSRQMLIIDLVEVKKEVDHKRKKRGG